MDGETNIDPTEALNAAELAELDERIAADEAADARERESRERRMASARSGPRAGQSARKGNNAGEAPESGGKPPESPSTSGQQSAGKPAADAGTQEAEGREGAGKSTTATQQGKPPRDASQAAGKTPDGTPEGEGKPPGAEAPEGGDQSPEGDPDAGKSPYEKARARQARAWQTINAKKAEMDLREQALAARETALASRPAAPPAAAPGAAGQFTPEQLVKAAGRFEHDAQQLEAQGRFDEADKKRDVARIAKDTARTAQAGGPGLGAQPAAAGVTLDQSWARLKTDMPELTQAGTPANQEVLAMLKAEPSLLADELGPYRVMVKVGRKMVGQLEQKAAQAEAQAARVPGLEAQIATLTKDNERLMKATSLPGGDVSPGGGGAAPPAFEKLSTDKMAEQLEAEMAQM